MIRITIVSSDDVILPNGTFNGKGGYFGAMKFYVNQSREIKRILKQLIIENWNNLKINYEIIGIKKCSSYLEWENEIKKAGLI